MPVKIAWEHTVIGGKTAPEDFPGARRDGPVRARLLETARPSGAINSADPRWPETLQGKAKEFHERYMKYAKPRGYKLKAMIINYPGGIHGDVG